jgi:hypothetical protein
MGARPFSAHESVLRYQKNQRRELVFVGQRPCVWQPASPRHRAACGQWWPHAVRQACTTAYETVEQVCRRRMR